MALSREDKADVKRAFGGSAARAVSKATDDGSKSHVPHGDAKSKAIHAKMSSSDGINKARKEQGYKPRKFDRATKGMHDFFDKYD